MKVFIKLILVNSINKSVFSSHLLMKLGRSGGLKAQNFRCLFYFRVKCFDGDKCDESIFSDESFAVKTCHYLTLSLC